jgi:mono/diheme cytochrome c family protein
MIRRLTALLAVLALGTAACSSGETEPIDLSGGDPQAGAEAYAASCAACHGAEAEGTNLGPPLVHEYYLPDHHEDIAFLLAVRTGVRAHHWDFGPMPAISGVSDEDVADIVAYVRGLQEAAGLL